MSQFHLSHTGCFYRKLKINENSHLTLILKVVNLSHQFKNRNAMTRRVRLNVIHREVHVGESTVDE